MITRWNILLLNFESALGLNSSNLFSSTDDYYNFFQAKSLPHLISIIKKEQLDLFIVNVESSTPSTKVIKVMDTVASLPTILPTIVLSEGNYSQFYQYENVFQVCSRNNLEKVLSEFTSELFPF